MRRTANFAHKRVHLKTWETWLLISAISGTLGLVCWVLGGVCG